MPAVPIRAPAAFVSGTGNLLVLVPNTKCVCLMTRCIPTSDPDPPENTSSGPLFSHRKAPLLMTMSLPCMADEVFGGLRPATHVPCGAPCHPRRFDWSSVHWFPFRSVCVWVGNGLQSVEGREDSGARPLPAAWRGNHMQTTALSLC